MDRNCPAKIANQCQVLELLEKNKTAFEKNV